MAEIRVETGDKPTAPDEKHPIVIVLDRLRSAHNVGNLFRLAEVCRIEKVVTCGYTATPPHPKLVKTAMGCDELVAFQHFDSCPDAVHALKEDGYRVVAVETVEGAPAIWDATFQFPLALVLGNEALGISQDALDLCDGFVRLPVFGSKNSMNVGNCAAVVLYRALEQLKR